MLIFIDYIIISLYVLTLIGIGFFAHRGQTEEGFLISERKVGILSGVATINATKTGAIIFVFTALLYQYGFSAMWYFIGVILGYIIFLPFASRIFNLSNSQYYTLSDYYRNQYGTVAGYASSLLTIVAMVGFLIINLIAATKVLTFFTPLSFSVSAAVISVVVLVYLILAGFSAVVKTDFFQYVAIVFVLCVFVFVLGNGVSIPSTEWTLFSARIADIVGFLILGALFPFASPDLWQRIYAIKDVHTMKKSVLWSIVVFGIVAFILSVVGLLIKTSLPELDPDFALVGGLAQLLPAGFSGLAIVVFFAALMSSIDTYVYTASSSIVQDLIRPSSKKTVVTVIKYAMLGIVMCATLIAILLQDLISASFLFAAFVVILAVPTIVTWVRPSVHHITLNTGLILGSLLLIVVIGIDFVGGNLGPIIVLKSLGIVFASMLIGSLGGFLTRRFRNTA